MMHQVLYIVQLPNKEGDMHILWHLMHHDMPCDPNLVSSAFYTIRIFPFIYLFVHVHTRNWRCRLAQWVTSSTGTPAWRSGRRFESRMCAGCLQ